MFSVFMLQYFLFFCPLPHLGRVILPLPPHSLQLMDAQSSESAETEENSKLGLRLIWQGMSIGAPLLSPPNNFGLFNALLWYLHPQFDKD